MPVQLLLTYSKSYKGGGALYNLDYNVVGQGIALCAKSGERLDPDPIKFFPYVNRVLKESFEQQKPTYPMEVKLPGSTAKLLKGDATPSQIIRINEPILTQDKTPMWFADSKKRVYLRAGYTNRDARYICDQVMDGEHIHMFIGGSSGHGKSVLLNTLIGCLCYEYAPWELEINLSDAKIVEFKRYGMGPHLPHIRSIAATSDADYVISVLERASEEMKLRSKIFSAFGVQNLADFRNKTGLVLPRVIIVCDEFESTCRMAGRRASVISDKTDEVARLGRSAGYHLMLATQNLTADIPKTALGQIIIRASLGATETVSTAVLGNDGAKDNMSKRGILIINNSVLNGGNTKPGNVTYQVPFQSDTDFSATLSFLTKTGMDTGYISHMDFYDEEDVKTVDSFKNTIDLSLSKNPPEEGESNVIVGFPAFVTPDPDGLLKLRLDHKDIENICVTSSVTDRLNAHLSNIAYSLSKQGYALRLLSPTVEEHLPFIDTKAFSEERSATNGGLAALPTIVKKRLLLMAIDEQVANVTKYDVAAVETAFEEDGVPRDKWSNTLLCKRAHVYLQLRSNPAKAEEWKLGFQGIPNLKELQANYEACHASIRAVTKSDFEKSAFFIGDLSKILGYGRESKSGAVTQLKLVMQDACRVNFLFVVFTKSMEGLTDLISGVRYTIFDLPDSRDWTRMRTEPPVELKDNLAVVYDSLDSSGQKKFKRTLLKEEV